MIDLKLNLFKCFVFFSFIPFFSFYPINTDVQPLAPVLALLIVTMSWFKFGVKKIELFYFFLVCTLFYFINPFGEFDLHLSKMVALILSFFIFLACKKVQACGVDCIPIIISVTYIYCFFTLIIVIEPSLGLWLQSLFVRNVNSMELGYRGISTLSTEPGLFAGVMVALFAILTTKYDFQKQSLFKYLLVSIALLTLLLMSKSGTGVALLLVYFLCKFLNGLRFFIMLAFMFGIVISAQFFQAEFKPVAIDIFGRGGEIFYLLLTEPSLLLADSSLFFRIYALIVGFLSIIYFPFGVGFGDVIYESNIIVENYNFLSKFYSTTRFGFSNVSSVGYYLTALGLVFLFPFIYVIYNSKAPFENKMLSLSMFCFSYSLAFPLSWFLLVIRKND